MSATCTFVSLLLSSSSTAVQGEPAWPVEVFMYGENITGWNPTNDTRTYYCFRIPELLALPSGRLLAFAEGRQDGCRPDANVNRPIVVRSSKDGGATWGPIGIAGPSLPHAGTNYPGAFVRDSKTVVLRYSLTNGSVFETTSDDEGDSWSQPREASQPPGQKCASAWPVMVGNEVIIACGGGSARSDDGGRSWSFSKKLIETKGTNVTGIGEMMPVADGRTSTSLTMMIRAGSHSGWLNHAIAQSSDLGSTWGPAQLLPVVGATCQGSIGRDMKAPPGQVLLATIYGANHYRLGRANMTVFTLDEMKVGSEPVPAINVWPTAAGYSDFAQIPHGSMMLLFEGGGGVYDYGIKISQISL